MKRIFKYIAILFLIVIAYFVITTYPKLDILSGFAAKSISSHYFIGDRDIEYTEAEDNLVPTMGMASSKLLDAEKIAKSNSFGFKKRTAFYRDGVGAVLIPSGKKIKNASLAKPNRNMVSNNFAYPYGDLPQKDTVFQNINYKQLNKVVNNAFVDAEGSKKKTRSALVIYKGQIIKEQYVNGFDEESMILGWSMAKSVTSAVIGVMVKEGKVSLHQNNLFEEWNDDSRKNITLANLLNMNSGLEWEEDYTKICDATKMLFLEEDLTRSQLIKPLIGEPNNFWNYSSGTSNLLSGFIRNQFPTHQDYLDYWYEKVIDKIGMHSMLVETDFDGNYVGSSYAWATTRDWAKFGLLYLYNGNWNGEQVLDPSWIAFTKKPTKHSNGVYGGHFWLNASGKFPDVPKDMFSCNGFQGQRVWIIPSKDLVVVRTGLHEYPFFDINQFLSEIISTIE
jgi:CubicO group peptidase (beta-lactamase class C family)